MTQAHCWHPPAHSAVVEVAGSAADCWGGRRGGGGGGRGLGGGGGGVVDLAAGRACRLVRAGGGLGKACRCAGGTPGGLVSLGLSGCGIQAALTPACLSSISAPIKPSSFPHPQLATQETPDRPTHLPPHQS